MRRNVIAVIAGCAACAALAPAAGAQNGFPDYRQAAADQYPTQPPPGNSGSSGNPSAGSSQSTAGSSGKPRPAQVPHGHQHAATTNGKRSGTAPASARGTAPVAVPTRPVPAAKSSLPFTGSDLSGLVVLALILLATGLLAAAAARATPPRPRPAPA